MKQNSDGLGQLTLIPSILSSVLGIGGGLLQADLAKNLAKQQVAQQIAAARAANTAAAQAAALQMQQEQIAAASTLRSQEIYALVAIGGVALVIGGMFIFSALKKGR